MKGTQARKETHVQKSRDAGKEKEQKRNKTHASKGDSRQTDHLNNSSPQGYAAKGQ
jgi:hypothetical protein